MMNSDLLPSTFGKCDGLYQHHELDIPDYVIDDMLLIWKSWLIDTTIRPTNLTVSLISEYLSWHYYPSTLGLFCYILLMMFAFHFQLVALSSHLLLSLSIASLIHDYPLDNPY